MAQVLIVDDEHQLRTSFERLLSAERYTVRSASTGEADWALRPLLATSSIPPKGLQNFAYYSNPKVDALLQKALGTTKAGEKTKIYKEAQEIIFKDAPWVFLVNTQQVYVRAKNLAGIYLMPDGSMNFDDIELK